MKGYRPFTTLTGYTVQYRTMPPDFLPALRARVRRAHEPTKPTAPTVRVETAPGTFADQPVSADGDLPNDPDLAAQVLNYRAALRAWEATVIDQITEEIKTVLLRTVRFELDAEAVAETRALYDLAGRSMDAYDDDHVMLFGVILTDLTDQQALAASLEGVPVEEAAAAMREAFRRQMERATAR